MEFIAQMGMEGFWLPLDLSNPAQAQREADEISISVMDVLKTIVLYSNHGYINWESLEKYTAFKELYSYISSCFARELRKKPASRASPPHMEKGKSAPVKKPFNGRSPSVISYNAGPSRI